MIHDWVHYEALRWHHWGLGLDIFVEGGGDWIFQWQVGPFGGYFGRQQDMLP